MYKFIQPLADEKNRKEIKEQEKNKAEIEKLKLNYPLYEKAGDASGDNFFKLTAYDEKKLFQAGIKKFPPYLQGPELLWDTEAMKRAESYNLAIPRAKMLVNIEETKKNTFITFGKN